jgi:hypothetical protein
MNVSLIFTLGLLLGGVDSRGTEPIVTRDSDAFRLSSRSLSAEDRVRFWDLVRTDTAGWAASAQLMAVQGASSDRAVGASPPDDGQTQRIPPRGRRHPR